MALGVFLLLSALSGLDLMLDRTGVYAASPWMTGILWSISLFLGPAILAYLVVMTGDPGRDWALARVVRITWPASVAVVLASPFFLLPTQTRLAIPPELAEPRWSGLRLKVRSPELLKG